MRLAFGAWRLGREAEHPNAKRRCRTWAVSEGRDWKRDPLNFFQPARHLRELVVQEEHSDPRWVVPV